MAEEDYTEEWEIHRWNRRWLACSLLGLALAALAHLLLPPLGGLWPFLIIVMMLSSVASTFFVNTLKCPRCGNPFFSYYWLRTSGERCPHCDLERPRALRQD